MKKIISLVLILVMITGLFGTVNVFASDSDTVKTVDFSDYSPSVNTDKPSNFTEMNYTITKNGTDRKVYYAVSEGTFGKPASDKSLVVQQIYHAGTSPQTQWYQLRYNPSIPKTTQRYVHLSTEMALAYTQANRWLGLQFNKTGGTDGKTYAALTDIMRIAPVVDNTAQVALSFFGEASTYAVPLQSWFKIDFTMDTVTGLADVYYNGEKVVENYSTGIGSDYGINITSFAQAIWGIYQIKTDPANGNNNYANSHTYIDNVYCALVDETPEIEVFEPYHKVTFSDYEGGSMPENFRLNSKSEFVSSSAVSGKFDTDADNVSFLASAQRVPSGTTNTARWEQVRYTNPLPAWVSNNDLYHKISFKMAYEGKYMNRWVNLAFTPWASNGSTEKWDVESNVTHRFMINIIKNDQTLDPELYVDGTLITSIDTNIIEQSKWIKFDIVANGSIANRVFDVYVNGIEVAKNIAMNVKSTNTWSRLANVAEVQLGINHEWSVAENCYPVADTYYDDLLITKHGTYPEIETYETETPVNFADITYYAGNEITDNVLEATGVDVTINNDLDALPVLAIYSIGANGAETLEDVVLGQQGVMNISAEFERGNKVTLLTLENITTLKPLYGKKTIINGVVGEMPTAEAFSVSGLFSDNGVIQRNRPVTVWGTSESEDGSTINVSFDNHHTVATVKSGKWQAILPAMPANTEGKNLYVYSATQAKQFSNILVGDVYFVAGQSNAELPFSTSETYAQDRLEISSSDNIRFFYQARSDALNLSEEQQLTVHEDIINPNYKWEIAQSHNTGRLSSLGYYFADAIADATERQIPIGLVQTAFGSARLQELSPKSINDIYSLTTEPDRIKYSAYNTLVAPAEKYTARGMLWYQGESDSKDDTLASTYAQRFNSLVEYIRGIQGNDFPVFYVQLSSHTDHEDRYSGYTYQWLVPRMRNEQNKTEDITPDTFMTVSLDKGLKVGDENDTAHPIYKKEIAQRMAAIAIERIYTAGNPSSVMSPKVKSIAYDAQGATITFERTNGSLALAEGSETLLGFELIKDGVATEATATITSANTVRVTGVASPDGVRYAYYNAAAQSIANLVGGNGLPCPTFSDNGFDVAALTLGQQR